MLQVLQVKLGSFLDPDMHKKYRRIHSICLAFLARFAKANENNKKKLAYLLPFLIKYMDAEKNAVFQIYEALKREGKEVQLKQFTGLLSRLFETIGAIAEGNRFAADVLREVHFEKMFVLAYRLVEEGDYSCEILTVIQSIAIERTSIGVDSIGQLCETIQSNVID